MMETLKKMFGLGPSADYAQMVKDGAIILDVRSKGEYAGGHIKGSINISVDQLKANLNRLSNKQKAIITCCASGMRSGTAKGILESHGYTNVHNGGSWMSLQHKI
jgi:phage shock protein E